jgi:hypothetical protein
MLLRWLHAASLCLQAAGAPLMLLLTDAAAETAPALCTLLRLLLLPAAP